MTRYFFHSQTDTRVTDEIGVEFKSNREARQEAIKACGEMIREAPDPFWGTRPWSITVTDPKGVVLWEIMVDGISSAVVAD